MPLLGVDSLSHFVLSDCLLTPRPLSEPVNRAPGLLSVTIWAVLHPHSLLSMTCHSAMDLISRANNEGTTSRIR